MAVFSGDTGEIKNEVREQINKKVKIDLKFLKFAY
jgi:DNA helicase TIP49 (TBP-interacting protein)